MSSKTKKRIVIELDDVERLARLQCTESEAAAFFKVGVNKFKKILNDFQDVKDAWDRGQAKGKTSLRRKQFALASSSASMAIHLGKNMLNQRESVTHEHTGAAGGPIQTLDLASLSPDDRSKLRELLLRAARSESAS